MRLRTKYALVLLATMLVLGSVLYVGTEQFKCEIVEQEQEELDRTTTLTAGQIDGSIRDQKNYVRLFAGRAGTANLSNADESLESFLDRLNFLSAQVVAVNGTIVAYERDVNETDAAAVVGTNVSNRSYIRDVRTTRQTVVSDPEPSGGLTVVTISAPIIERTGNGTELRGILVGAINLSASRLFTAKEPLETETQSVAIVGETVEGNELVLDPADESFDDALTSTATVSETGWEVTVQRDRSQLDDQLSTLRTVQSGGLLLVLISFLLLGFWEYRTNLRQTQRLLDGFAALRRGEFDHEVDLDTAEE